MIDMIHWTNEQRRLGDLVPWPRNPRQIREPQAKRLVESFGEFGQVETLAIGPDNEIYNGHQRLNALRAEHGADYMVDVRVSSRPLTEREREKLTVYLHKGAAGEWDFDVLANEFDLDDLTEWGFAPIELGILPDEAAWEDSIGGLPDGEKAPFQQMTFTLHDSQAEQIKDALAVAKSYGAFDSPNENSNGNALARICETYLTDYGQG